MTQQDQGRFSGKPAATGHDQALHDVRVAATVILVASIAFGWSYAPLIPEAPASAALMGMHCLWLYRAGSLAAAIAVLAWALAGAVLAVLWTAEGRFGGGHIVLLALFVLWVAQRALESTRRPALHARHL